MTARRMPLPILLGLGGTSGCAAGLRELCGLYIGAHMNHSHRTARVFRMGAKILRTEILDAPDSTSINASGADGGPVEKCADEGACGGKGEGEPEMASPLPVPTLFSNCAYVVVNNFLQTAVPDSITTVAEAAFCFLSYCIRSNSSQSISSLQCCLVANSQKSISQEESPDSDAPPHHDDLAQFQ